MQGAEGIEPAVAEQAQPLGELTHAAAEQIGNLETGLAVGNPEHGGEAFVEALVLGLATAALEFLALLPVEVKRLHRAPFRAGPGPFAGGNCCSCLAGIVDCSARCGNRTSAVRHPIRPLGPGTRRERLLARGPPVCYHRPAKRQRYSSLPRAHERPPRPLEDRAGGRRTPRR